MLRHLKYWQEFIDSDPTCAIQNERMIFRAGNEECKLQKIAFYSGGQVVFDDMDSEYIERMGDDSPSAALIRQHMRGMGRDTRERLSISAKVCATPEEVFQATLVHDCVLPFEFTTLYNQLLNTGYCKVLGMFRL